MDNVFKSRNSSIKKTLVNTPNKMNWNANELKIASLSDGITHYLVDTMSNKMDQNVLFFL